MSQLFMRRPNLDALPDITLPADYALRAYQPEDLPSLAALMRAAFEDETWTPEKVLHEVLNDATVLKTFVVEHDGAIVATASARVLPNAYPDSGYVHWVAAHPAHMGKKLGAGVTIATLHEFARLGLKDAVLETDDHRLAAIKTYQNLEIGRAHV